MDLKWFKKIIISSDIFEWHQTHLGFDWICWGSGYIHGVFDSSWGVQTCRFFFSKLCPRFAHAQVHLAQMKDKQHSWPSLWGPFAMLRNGGGFKYDILYVHPYLGKINPIWRSYVSNGLVQPPTLWCSAKSQVQWTLYRLSKVSWLSVKCVTW